MPLEAAPLAPTDHRTRLIAAMAEAVREGGYRATTVADVVRRARTSRRTFYEHFADREDCFLALFDAVNDDLMRAVASSLQLDAPWEEQVDAALGAFLAGVAAEPALFQSFVRELPAVGENGAAREVALVQGFARLLVGMVESGRVQLAGARTDALELEMAILIVGGLRELTVVAISERRDVRQLHATASAAVKAILRGAVLHEPRA